jgi:L-alanine-DL-glutamate epimerase-like enolase superfamily enzyme
VATLVSMANPDLSAMNRLRSLSKFLMKQMGDEVKIYGVSWSKKQAEEMQSVSISSSGYNLL